MINRVLIRSKITQLVYSHLLKQQKDLNVIEKELFFSFQKTYDLYHLLMQLVTDITYEQELRLDTAKHKHLSTYEDLNPNTRFIDNRFAQLINSNIALQDYLAERKLSWSNHQGFIKTLTDAILESEIYTEYMSAETTDFETDRQFWKKIFKNIILPNPELYDILEEDSIYWNDDMEVLSSFLLKTIKRLNPALGNEQPLLPMFKEDEDKQFAQDLLRETFENIEANRRYIDQNTSNWEVDRIAFMDVVIMSVAIAELRAFPSIPINVTLNEYIELAKTFSTEKSGTFVNGVLDSIVEQLKKEGRITK